MKNKQLKIIVFALLAITMVSTLPILVRDPIFMDSQEFRHPDVFFSSYSSNGSFKFNSETILEALKTGDQSIFTSIEKTSAEPIYSTSFAWKQFDYLAIANAAHQFVWKESVSDWNLSQMSFWGQCNPNLVEFDIIRLSYYKPTGLQEYSVHMIGIYPLAGQGEWGGGANFSHSVFSGWTSIDLDKLTVTVEEALQIAETNGGKSARIQKNNLCTIHLSLASSPYPEWRISYSLNINASQIFEIRIDAYTGDYEILNH